ncbi:GTP cyclohydrolase II/3,4-dihydroxy-2-butanone 4-phosphate synthase [Prauserella sp. Am3]|nr:GTP cyclohydrolase II/3,4-dihydroxy-2-butanone 4-phosphate synthase [Prauserella sp. Am3]
MSASKITEALDALARGAPVLVVDDEDRENEGDLIMAAELATTDDVAFFLEYTSGFLCVAIDEQRARALDLDLMVAANTESQGTAFLVSVDYKHDTTTGISAADRATTTRALANPRTTPGDLARPGHIMPLLAKKGGVQERAGHTEAGVDLCRLAGLSGAALLCELVTPDRRAMMRRPELETFAERHDIPIITIAELAEWMQPPESLPRCTGYASIPTDLGTFQATCYESGGVEHLVLTMGEVDEVPDPLVRIHSECLTGDLAGSLRCDCGAQLRMAMGAIAEEGRGVLVYMRNHEGRGIGLGRKLQAYQLQQSRGLNTMDANVELGLPVDGRDYADAAHILIDLGVSSVRLMTNNPDKCAALAERGITVTERIATEAPPNEHNIGYLTTKRDFMGHLLHQPA